MFKVINFYKQYFLKMYFFLVPPKIGDKATHQKTVKRGGQAEIWCEAVGIPPPKITWLKDNKTVVINCKICIIYCFKKLLV